MKFHHYTPVYNAVNIFGASSPNVNQALITFTSMNTQQFLKQHRRLLSIRGIEKKAGLGINELSHIVGREERPMFPYTESKLKTLLKQLRNDLNRVKL